MPVPRYPYSFGKSSIEILAARLGKTTEPVEAVVFPDYGTVEKLIKDLDPKKYQLIPVGGASNVTGDLSYSKGKVKIALTTKSKCFQIHAFRIPGNILLPEKSFRSYHFYSYDDIFNTSILV